MTRISAFALAAFAALITACGGGDPASDEDQIKISIGRYVQYIDDEDWDGMCSLFASEIQEQVGCEQVQQALLSAAFLAGTNDVHAQLIAVSEVTATGDEGYATYDMCIAIGDERNCSAETVHMLKEGGEWKVGLTQTPGQLGEDLGQTPPATRDQRLGTGTISKTVMIDADDQGQSSDPTFSVTSITANAGEIVEVIINNMGSVAHNINFAGTDGEYGTPDDWVSEPQTIRPGESGKVLVKFDQPGTYSFQCDFHPVGQSGLLIVD